MSPDFNHHPKFTEELEEFITKHTSGNTTASLTVEYLERLLDEHFIKNNIQFTKKHLGRAPGFGAHEVYFLHLAIPDGGLSRTQYPKAYLFKYKTIISFLCLDSHIQNYKDSELRKVAGKRLTEILELIKST
jgi:hypothetical protein